MCEDLLQGRDMCINDILSMQVYGLGLGLANWWGRNEHEACTNIHRGSQTDHGRPVGFHSWVWRVSRVN